MINSSWSTNYKYLAKKAELTECLISEAPISTIVVDVRSRLFRYIRLYYKNRTLAEKIDCAYKILYNMKDEKIKVFQKAMQYIQDDVKMLNVSSCVYVFGSPIACPYKKALSDYRETKRKEKWNQLQECMKRLSQHMFDIDTIIECNNIFEGYLMCCLDKLHYNIKDLPFVVPDYKDNFESDKLLGKLGKKTSILSDDYDCVALFGANMMIKNVYPKWFEYVTLRDLLAVFKSPTRTDLVYKCCLLGTDYNLGFKGIGSNKVTKIDKNNIQKRVSYCLKQQSIDIDKLMQFFLQDDLQ
jgi:5'-3' exonuclease